MAKTIIRANNPRVAKVVLHRDRHDLRRRRPDLGGIIIISLDDLSRHYCVTQVLWLHTLPPYWPGSFALDGQDWRIANAKEELVLHWL